MKEVTIYTDGVFRGAEHGDVPARPPQRRRLGDDTAPSESGETA